MQRKPTPKHETVELRLTPGEKADWVALATKLQRPLSDVLRQWMNTLVTLLRDMAPEGAPVPPRKTVAERRAEGTLPPLPPKRVVPEPALTRALTHLTAEQADTPAMRSARRRFGR